MISFHFKHDNIFIQTGIGKKENMLSSTGFQVTLEKQAVFSYETN